MDLSECVAQFRDNASSSNCIQLIVKNSFCDYKCLNGNCINNSW
jgi:wyosine [tRNA(Phe)-imidazoG37] synthetase (radical SAM superfamily)